MIYLFGGSDVDFQPCRSTSRNPQLGRDQAVYISVCTPRVKQLLLSLQGATKTFSFPDPPAEASCVPQHSPFPHSATQQF